ncbi:MAG: hypothetical protein ACKVU2_03180, partial [Saprospiraceae bacterium]
LPGLSNLEGLIPKMSSSVLHANLRKQQAIMRSELALTVTNHHKCTTSLLQKCTTWLGALQSS